MKAHLSAGFRRVLAVLGTSRHSLLPALRAQGTGARPRSALVQAGALACGSILIGVAVALLVEADLGLAPYDVFSSGVSEKLDVTLGQAGWVVAGGLFVVSSLLGHRPSLWGVAYILANGVTIDATTELFASPTGVGVRIAYLAAAIVIMAAGVNVVLFSGTTGGPFELLMQAGEDRGVNRTNVRYVLDAGVLTAGLVLGGAFGVGTVIYGATMGLTLQVSRQAFDDYRRGREHRRATQGSAIADP